MAIVMIVGGKEISLGASGLSVFTIQSGKYKYQPSLST